MSSWCPESATILHLLYWIPQNLQTSDQSIPDFRYWNSGRQPDMVSRLQGPCRCTFKVTFAMCMLPILQRSSTFEVKFQEAAQAPGVPYGGLRGGSPLVATTRCLSLMVCKYHTQILTFKNNPSLDQWFTGIFVSEHHNSSSLICWQIWRTEVLGNQPP
jgi:hypothetical protein